LPGRSSSGRPSPEAHEGLIAVGFVRGPRGTDGELKVESLTDNPERFRPGAVLRAGAQLFTVRSLREHRGVLLLRFEGIHSREQAEGLRSLLLEVPETDLAALDEGEYYRFQLIGLEVRDTAGNVLGRLEEVLETGANDVYIVRDAESELLVPAVEPVVQNIDLSRGRIVIEVPPGLERRPLAKRLKDRSSQSKSSL
jgi:16S rRNA processing protein RimM